MSQWELQWVVHTVQCTAGQKAISDRMSARKTDGRLNSDWLDFDRFNPVGGSIVTIVTNSYQCVLRGLPVAAVRR